MWGIEVTLVIMRAMRVIEKLSSLNLVDMLVLYKGALSGAS
jgi:hypothetical protein